MTRSTAGAAFAGPCDWLRQVHDGAGYHGPILVVLQALAFAAHDRRGIHAAAPGVEELARVSGQKRDTVMAQLRRAVEDGWLDAGRRGRGRGGACTVYELALPALVRRAEYVPVGGPIDPQYVPLGGPIPSEYVPVGGPIDPQYVPAEGPIPSPPITPPGGREGKVPPTPHDPPRLVPGTTPAGLWAEEAAAVMARLPIRMRGNSDSYRARFARHIERWLGDGWRAGELVELGTNNLPDEIRSPISFMQSRMPDRPPSRLSSSATSTPADRRWTPEPVTPAADEHRAAVAAAARAQIRAGRQQ